MEHKYAEIIVSISHKDVDKIFEYKVPDGLREKLLLGSRVIIPFGKSNKKYDGFVVGFKDTSEFDDNKIKYILDVTGEKPVFSYELLQLAKWMKNKYYTTLIDCIKCIIPTGLHYKSDCIIKLIQLEPNFRMGKKQKAVFDYIKKNDFYVLQSQLETEFDNINSIINSFKDKGIVQFQDISEIKDLSLKTKFAYINYENENIEQLITQIKSKDSPQKKIIDLLIENESLAVSDIKKYLHISNSPLSTLAKNNIIIIEDVEVYRNTIDINKIKKDIVPTPTSDQQKALDFIQNKNNTKPVLIHGITGSGKTEIYLRLIENVLKKGKQAIILVPEISLTPQTVNTFIKRFGELVSVTHSRLTIGERYDQWKKARDGKISIMIGPRSAVFAPFNNLGIIIIDEEHEKTYKSETTPKYSAKEVAIERGRLTNSLIILGSATPSIESYYEAEMGKIDLITIEERVNKRLPDIFISDMRNELAEGNTTIFSHALSVAIEEALEKNEQIILFLNRRGFSTFVSCRRCGYVMTCDNCNVNYTYHIYSDKLICHYCGKTIKNTANCPQCGSKFIKYFGVGTQKIEDEVKKKYPNVNVLRMDMDTTSGKHSHESILNKFRNGEAQILIGTQMIAKGLDFPNVSLVGIIAADLSLNNGDFRAGETTYQLITQVSGRAGRAEVHGKVYIQTYNPEHYSIIYAKDNNYKEFYNHEISLRKQMIYPPFSHIFSILFTSSDEKKIITALFKLLEIMKYYNRKGLFEMLGPTPAIVSKIKKRYRWKLLVKSVDEDKIKSFVFYCMDKLKQYEDISDISINLTLNPSLLV